MILHSSGWCLTIFSMKTVTLTPFKEDVFPEDVKNSELVLSRPGGHRACILCLSTGLNSEEVVQHYLVQRIIEVGVVR